MSGKRLIYASGAVWCLTALYLEAPIVAAIALFGHMVMLAVHNVEVKINKLLDERDIYVTRADLDDA